MSCVKSILKMWKKNWHNPDATKISPSFQIEHMDRKVSERSVQEATYDSEGVVVLTGWNRRTYAEARTYGRVARRKTTSEKGKHKGTSGDC